MIGTLRDCGGDRFQSPFPGVYSDGRLLCSREFLVEASETGLGIIYSCALKGACVRFSCQQ